MHDECKKPNPISNATQLSPNFVDNVSDPENRVNEYVTAIIKIH